MTYCPKMQTRLETVAEKCDPPTFEKVDNLIPRLIRSDKWYEPMVKRTKKETLDLIDDAMVGLNIELNSTVAKSYMSAHPIELLEACWNLEISSWRGQIFIKCFTKKLAESVEQKIRKQVDCPFDLSVLYGKEVPSLSEIIKELLTIDLKLDYLILECANNVFKKCRSSDFEVKCETTDGIVSGDIWPIVREGFANQFRQDLIDEVQKHDLTVFNKLLSSFPPLENLPQFMYKPQYLM